MKALVIGTGSIGRRHINNLIKLGIKVSAYSYRRSELIKFENNQQINRQCNLDYALKEECDFIVICNSTEKHIEVAIEAAKLLKNLYIEKPISNSLNKVDELITISDTNNLLVDSGFVLRSHPNLNWISQFLRSNSLGEFIYASATAGQLLSDWRHNGDYRKSYSAFKSMGGGAIFDLIHELDIIYWLFGKVNEVTCMTQEFRPLDIESESVAQMLIKLETGQTAHVRVDYVRPNYSRKLELVFEKGILYWDYLKGEVFIEERNKKPFLVNSIPENFNRNDIFISHMKSFLNKINAPYSHKNSSLKDGYEVLKIALASHESALKKRSITIY